MTLYTRTGDDGTTALFGGKRVLKSDPAVEAYGAIDELTSYIGLITCESLSPPDLLQLEDIQKNLYMIMATLAGSDMRLDMIEGKITLFEKTIDRIEAHLPKLHVFVYPRGTRVSVLFHIARTICRRAERRLVSFFAVRAGFKPAPTIIKYINRLSDLLFTYARFYTASDQKTK